MADHKKNEVLINKWSNFFNIIFDPWVLLLLLGTIIFIYYSTGLEDKKLLSIVTLIISLISGLLGGIIANRWAQMTELKVLVLS